MGKVQTPSKSEHCTSLSHFPNSLKEAKVITVPKHGKDPKFPQNLRLLSHLSITGELFRKVGIKIVHGHVQASDLFNASHFGSRARYSTTPQCLRSMLPLISTIIRLRLRYSWTSKKHLIQYGALACYMNYPN
jgi:hypothetical protein